MRPTIRLLASAGQLVPFIPTGLTGIATHPSPRPHLIHIYKSTLKALATLPANSVYRQSTEALTKHRLAIVEAQTPPGYEEWKSRISKEIESHPEYDLEDVVNGGIWADESRAMDRYGFVDDRELEWDGEPLQERAEGPQSVAESRNQAKEFGADVTEASLRGTVYAPADEPSLSSAQVSDIENQVGSGLIEEIVIVAKRELELVKTMKDNAVWEELVEKPVEGQWAYNARDRGTAAAGQTMDYTV